MDKTNSMNINDFLGQLFKECEHGDEQHRQWLKGKFNSFLLKNADDLKADTEATFIDKLIEELPNHGIDTLQWEYKYGDCCNDAVEFIARAINEISDNLKQTVLNK